MAARAATAATGIRPTRNTRPARAPARPRSASRSRTSTASMPRSCSPRSSPARRCGSRPKDPGLQKAIIRGWNDWFAEEYLSDFERQRPHLRRRLYHRDDHRGLAGGAASLQEARLHRHPAPQFPERHRHPEGGRRPLLGDGARSRHAGHDPLRDRGHGYELQRQAARLSEAREESTAPTSPAR